MSSFAFIRPGNDRPARTLGRWGGPIIDVVRSDRIHLIAFDLRRPWFGDLDRSAVLTALANGNATVILYFGHGTATAWVGSRPLLERHDVRNLAGRIAIAVACSTLRPLGQEATASGALAYAGFTDQLLWCSSVGSEFAAAISSGLSTFVRYGQPLATAWAAVEATFRGLHDQYKTGSGRSHPDAPIVWVMALWDADHMGLEGDGSVRA